MKRKFSDYKLGIGYMVASISKHYEERKIASFDAANERKARRKFKKWFPDGDGFLKYKLYKMIDMSAGKK